MRKKIGVFIGEIAQAYQTTAAKVIAEKANRLGYDTVFLCLYGSYNVDIPYSEGEKSIIGLPDYSIFDGIIATEDVFDIAGLADDFYLKVRESAKCPVVYLRTKRDGCYSIMPDNLHSMESMVRHFTDVHGFTDICFMSGKKSLQDAADRLQGFKNVMAEKGLTITEHSFFQGDYWRDKGKEAVDWFLEGRENYPQAIICANDYMALSVCEELRERGIRVPEDICVSGFDYIDEAKFSIPTLTSLEVDFETLAERAVEIIDNVNQGQTESDLQYVEANLRLHKSCGCGGQYKYKNIYKLIESSYQNMNDTKNTLLSVTDYQDSFEFDDYMAVADRYRRFLHTNSAYYCFCDFDEFGSKDVENDNMFTEHMVLRRLFEDDKPVQKAYITFPRRKLLPDEYWREDEPNNIFIFTIHFKNIVYGYVATREPIKDWFDIYTQGYFMALANAIESGEVHNKMERLESIKAIYQKDALTGLYNRRGFDKILQEKYTDINTTGTHLGIVSVDMDNLKVINDNYGHAEGDRALIALAKALNSSMKDGDYCARIGGDEFSAVLDLSYPGRCSEFKQNFNEALKKMADGYDYKVEASVGICETSEHSASSLVACTQIADKRMYEEKRSRKANVR